MGTYTLQSNRRSLEGKREKWMEEVPFGGGATKAEVKLLACKGIGRVGRLDIFSKSSGTNDRGVGIK